MDLALRLVAEGLGDSYLPSAYTHTATYPDALTAVSFAPEAHMQAMAAEFDRLR